jgi:hypothetical protein
MKKIMIVTLLVIMPMTVHAVPKTGGPLYGNNQKAIRYELTVVSLCDGQKTYATYKERSLVRARYWQSIFRKDKKYIATWIKRIK